METRSTSTTSRATDMTDKRMSRRLVLTGGLAAVGGAAAATGVGALRSSDEVVETEDQPTLLEPFHGRHQAGIATAPQGHVAVIGLDIASGVDADRFAAVLRMLSNDAERLTQGQAALGDTEPQLAILPARLTVTFGFGYAMFDKLGLADRRPADFTVLPEFSLDELDPAFGGGDLMVQICSDDVTAVAHAMRMLVKDARSIMRVRWVQRGFRQTAPVIEPGATPRNVMGQLDGTSNPTVDELDAIAWRGGTDWTRDGSTMVIRRIRAEMETWDAVDPVAKDMIIGRRTDTGAPLTGQSEHDEPDFDAVDRLRLPVIAANAHIRRARLADGRRIFRRAYNYDDQLTAHGIPDTGLLFIAYQADIGTFVDMQRRIDEADMLNSWVTPVGSAEFLIPPGCDPGGWIGETLLS